MKIYFFIILIIFVYTLFGVLLGTFVPGISDDTLQYGLSDWLGLLLIGVLLFGTYSYVFKKITFSKQIWKVIGVFMILLLGVGLFQSIMGSPVNQWIAKLVLPLPAIYVFYKLGWSK